MNVEKIIRILGYIVYTILWMPVIILVAILGPLMWLCIGIRLGCSAADCMRGYAEILKRSIKHDVDFIRYGHW